MSVIADDPLSKIFGFLTPSATWDDDSTPATILKIIPKGGIEDLEDVFDTYDGIVAVKPYSTEFGRWIQSEPFQVERLRIIEITTTDKTNVSGVFMLYKLEKSIEDDIEANKDAIGTIGVRIIGRSDLRTQRVGGRTVYSMSYICDYRTS